MYPPEKVTDNNSANRFQWNAATEADYWEARAKTYVAAPVEIDLHKYMDALEALPPLDWQGDEGSESFKFAEMMCGRVTDIYAKVEGRYFQLCDECTLSHAEIVERVKEVIREKTASRNEKSRLSSAHSLPVYPSES